MTDQNKTADRKPGVMVYPGQKIDELCAENARLRVDAGRYRWLRDRGHIKFLTRGAEVDRIVDEEMAKPEEECIL